MMRRLCMVAVATITLLLLVTPLAELPSFPAVPTGGLAHAGPVALVALELRP